MAATRNAPKGGASCGSQGPADELRGDPEARGIDEISGKPGEQKFGRHAFDQVRQSICERNCVSVAG